MMWALAITDIALIIVCGVLLYINREIHNIKLTIGYLISKTHKKGEIVEVDTSVLEDIVDQLTKTDQGGTEE